MGKPNAIIAQSGGPTAVINSGACEDGLPVYMRFKRKPLKQMLPKYI